jgi:hypothetical protein
VISVVNGGLLVSRTMRITNKRAPRISKAVRILIKGVWRFGGGSGMKNVMGMTSFYQCPNRGNRTIECDENGVGRMVHLLVSISLYRFGLIRRFLSPGCWVRGACCCLHLLRV